MKTFKNKLFLMGLAAIFSIGVIACSESEENEEDIAPSESVPGTEPTQPGGEDPIFPSEVSNLYGHAEDTLTLSFAANLDWQLTTNALWCKLGNDGLFDLSGTKGEQEVAIYLTKDNLGFTSDSAEISLTMGGQSQVIAKVFRSAIEREMTITESGVENGINYNNDNPVIISSYGSISLNIDANFEWNIASDIEWLTLTRDSSTITLDVINDYLQNPIENSSDIVIINTTDGDNFINLNIQYAGMDPKKISFSPNSKWNLGVTADGLKYLETGMEDMEIDEYDAPYTVQITALNSEYTIIPFKVDPTWGMSMFQPEMGDPAWVTINDDKQGNINVTFNENTGAKREMYLMAFPNAIYEEIKDNLEESLCDVENDAYLLKVEHEKHIIAHFIQNAAETGDLGSITASVLTGGMEQINVTMLNAENNMEGLYDAISSEYAISSVGYMTVEPEINFQIIPSVKDWNGEISIFVGNSSTDVAMDWGVEPWESDGKMAIQMNIPWSAAGSMVYVVFKIDQLNQQVVVIDLTGIEISMKVTNSLSGEDIPVTKADSESDLFQFLSSEYTGLQSVYSATVNVETNMIVVPTAEFDNVKIFYNGDNTYTNQAEAWSLEGIDQDGSMAIFLSVPKEAAGKNVQVALYSQTNTPEILYLTVNGEERAETVTIAPTNVWNIQFDADGGNYNATVTALNNDYVLVAYNYTSERGMACTSTYNPAWYKVNDDKNGNITITVPANSGKERKGYLFAIPGIVYEEFGGAGYEDNFFIADQNVPVWEMKTSVEKYVVGEFVQAGAAAEEPGNVTANYLTGNMESIDVTMLTESGELAELYYYVLGELGASSGAYVAPEAGKPFSITPSISDWDDISIFIQGDNTYTDYAKQGWAEPAMDQSGKMYVMLYIDETANGSFVEVLFKKSGMTAQAVIVDYSNVVVEKNMNIYNSQTMAAIETTKVAADSDMYMYIASEYGATSVFSASTDANSNLFIAPTVEFDAVKIFIEGDNTYTDFAPEWGIEGMMMMEQMGVLVPIPENAAGKNTHIVFYSNYMAQEVLYLTVKGQERAESVTINPTNVWNIQFDATGGEYNATVTALNNDYVLVAYNYSSEWGMTCTSSNNPAWYTVNNDNNGNITVTIPENSGEERKGYLFAIPGVVYEEFGGAGYEDNFFIADQSASVWEMKTSVEKYVVGEFVQAGGNSGSSLVINNGMTMESIEVTSHIDDEMFYYLNGEYGASKVYSTATNASAIQITPSCEFDDVKIFIEGDESGTNFATNPNWFEFGGDIISIWPDRSNYAGATIHVAFYSNYMAQEVLSLKIEE